MVFSSKFNNVKTKKKTAMINLLKEQKWVSEEEHLDVKVRREEGEEDGERLVSVFRRSGECVGGDKTDIAVK